MQHQVFASTFTVSKPQKMYIFPKGHIYHVNDSCNCQARNAQFFLWLQRN